MTLQRSHKGYTLVEIAIVIVVIGLLASIAVVAFNNVLKQARDDKRENDMKVLMEAMDSYYNENGNYPIGCSYYGAQPTCADQLASYSSAYPGSTSPPTIGRDTTRDDLKAIFKNIDDSFGSPTYGGNIFNQPATISGGSAAFTSRDTYFFRSQDMLNISTSSYLQTNSSGGYLSCGTGEYQYDYQGVYRGNRPHDYIIGYFSEVQQKWIFHRGPKLSSLNDSRWNYDAKPECAPVNSS